MWFLQGILEPPCRLMLCAIFIMAAVAGKIPNFQETVAEMEGQGRSAGEDHVDRRYRLSNRRQPDDHPGATKAVSERCYCWCSLGFATYYFHDFWNNEATKDVEILHFMKNLSLAGALVFILGNGSGAWSLDGRNGSTDEDFL